MSEIVLDDYYLSTSLLYSHSLFGPLRYSQEPHLDDLPKTPVHPIRCFYNLYISQSVVAALGIAVVVASFLYHRHASPAVPSKERLWPRRLSLALILLSAATAALQFAYSPVRNTSASTHTIQWLATGFTEVSLALMLAESRRVERTLLLRAGSVTYWSVVTALGAISLRLHMQDPSESASSLYAVTCYIGLSCSILMILIESGLSPAMERSKHPWEQASLLSFLGFGWISPLISRGDKTFLTLPDLYELRPQDQSAVSETLLEEHLNDVSTEKCATSLLWAIFGAFWKPYGVAGAYKLCADISMLAQPMLLRKLLLFISSHTTSSGRSLDRGIVIAISLFAVSVTQVVCKHQYTVRSKLVGMRVTSALSLKIYSRAMTLDADAQELYPVGNIINLLSIDLRRLSDSFAEGHMLWSAPLQTLVGLLLIYKVAGSSLLAGIPVILLTAFAILGTATFEKRYQASQMQAKDVRLSLLASTLANIKNIKLYDWSRTFLEKIEAIRHRELRLLVRVGVISATNQTILALAPFMISCSVFWSLAFIERVRLTSDVLFPILALLNTIQFPLTRLPLVITRMITAVLALRRVEALLSVQDRRENQSLDHFEQCETGPAISITDARLSWTIARQKVDLRIDDLSLGKGQLLCVLGRIAAGKSSLLNAIQGSLHLRRGKVKVNGRSVYVPQKAWLLASTIRENILFGERWNEERYNETLRACSLLKDLSMLPRGDLTFVGDGAVSLSGGQKMRVTLARAVYANADLYLIDDCLAAVDSHVAQVLVQSLFSPSGLLRDSTTVLVTNNHVVMPYADNIILIEGGQIVEYGTYDEILQKHGQAARFLKSMPAEKDSRELSAELDPEEAISDYAKVVDSLSTPSECSTVVMTETTTDIDPSILDEEYHQENTLTSDLCLTEKDYSIRRVEWKVYLKYFRAASFPAWILSAFLIILGQASYIGTTVWLKKWSSRNDTDLKPDHNAMYLGVYIGIGALCAVLLMVPTATMAAFCCIRASKRVHQDMIASILAAPMRFFDSTSSGKVLNRFSSDLRRIDEVLPETLSSSLKYAAKTLFLLTIICMGTPLFAVLIIPLLIMYLSLQRRYLRSARDLTRLQHTTYSSVLSFCQDTLAGASTIRSFGQQDNFLGRSRSIMDDHLKATFLCITTESWLGVRLESIGSLTVLLTVSLSLLSLTSGDIVSPSTCGLIISSSLQIATLLNLLVWKAGILETDMISLEKVLEYSELEQEDFPETVRKAPPASWPSSGSIAFHNYSARYSPNLPLVLSHVSFELNPGERLGVVGRTGAGKSSLVLALFRVIEAATGHISIDGLNTNNVSLEALRKCLAVIPQDHFLFEGTIRDNLCPGGERDDTDIWAALEIAGLKPLVSALGDQLESRVLPDGSNISQGFRQLFSLARVFLSSAKIVLLDEPTASVDAGTDALIQSVLRGPGFAGRTIITIAHRLGTVLDYDRILVMDRGRVAEFDTPANLLEQKGLFWQLVHGNTGDEQAKIN